MKAAALLLFVSLLGLSCGFTASFSGNVSLSNIDEYKYRQTTVTVLNAIAFVGANMVSVSVNGGQGQANVDFVYASSFAGLGIVPSTYVSYFTSSATNPTPGSISFGASKSVITNTYLKIEEINATGVVRTQKLDGTFTVTDSKVQGGPLSWTTLQTNVGKFGLTLTTIFSSQVGVLDVAGNPVITPKSIETLLTISGWEYASDQNQLVLSIGVGSATGTVSGTGNSQFTAGTGTDAVFLNLGTKATVEGKNVDVKVSALADLPAADFGNAALSQGISTKYGGNASFKVVKVTFPAGAKTISYDPTIGAGANPPQQGSASKLAMMAVLAVFFLLF